MNRFFSSSLLRVWEGSDTALESGSQVNRDCRSASPHTQSSRNLSYSSPVHRQTHIAACDALIARLQSAMHCHLPENTHPRFRGGSAPGHPA